MALQPWYKVATPRADLRDGRPLDASEFAVHLDQVADGRAPEDYRKPDRFFARTYVTGGLADLGAEVLRRLSGEAVGASPVIVLTTQFGGGKTHALTMLYHLANAGPTADPWPGVKDILARAQLSSVPKAAVAWFVGTAFDSIAGRGGPGEPRRMTPWGDIAWQLGGPAAFEVVAEHDKKLSRPSKEVIRRFLPKDRPSLILMDEVLNYLDHARSIRAEGSLLSDQFFQFLQALSEEVSAPGSTTSLVLSLPKSELEMTEKEWENLGRLEKLSSRPGKPYILSEGLEIAEIIRRRLFEDIGPQKDRAAVARAYAKWVREHREQLPGWFSVDRAQETFEATYPFHPSLLSVFERKWQTLGKFQRTRDVLRMLALWVSRSFRDGFSGAHKDAVIGLGMAPLQDVFFRAAMLEQLNEPKLEAAIMSDIAGPEAHAVSADESAADSIRRAHVYQKVASAIFFESNGGQTKDYATPPEVRLAVGEPGLDIGYVQNALEELPTLCHYLQGDANRYWFSQTANLVKLHADRTGNVEGKVPERVREEIVSVFAAGSGVERVYFPDNSSRIPDRAVLTLVVLPPEKGWEAEARERTLAEISQLTSEHGQSGRTFKSALIFAVADGPGALKKEACDLLAWEDLADEAADEDKLPLDESQKRQLRESLNRAKRNLREAVWRTYRNVLLLGPDGTWKAIDLGLPHSSAAESLVSLILARLMQEGDLEPKVSADWLARHWPQGLTEWSTKSVRCAFFAAPQFPRLSEPDSLKGTISDGVSKTPPLFGYASKREDGTYHRVVVGEALSEMEVEFSDDVVLLLVEAAQAAKAGIAPKERKEVEKPGTDEGKTPVRVVTPAAKVAGIRWEGDVPPQKWMNFYTKVLSRFGIGEGLSLRVSVQARPASGISPQQIEETKTALRELGLPEDVAEDKQSDTTPE